MMPTKPRGNEKVTVQRPLSYLHGGLEIMAADKSRLKS